MLVDSIDCLPRLKMDLEFVDVGGNVGAARIGGQNSLFHAEEGGGQGCDTVRWNIIVLKDVTGPNTFEGARNLDTNPLCIERRIDPGKDVNNASTSSQPKLTGFLGRPP